MTTTDISHSESLKASLIRWHDWYCGPRTIYVVRVMTWTGIGYSCVWLWGMFHAP